MDERCRQFFLQPEATFHRRYEAFRAVFIDGQPVATVAERFGYRLASFKSLVCRFRAACARGGPPPFLFRTDVADLPVGAAAKTKTAPNAQTSPMSGS
jgi:hypothetical protein